ncbi:MAG: exodeoxyribonuclease VII large subunit, partial [Clostridia bacterium]|nr:exodeoxyribonuclease VII large subunit [Clostridia bacterium]
MNAFSEGAAALSVSELNEYARRLMAGDPLLRSVEVTGEISGYKHHYSGHRYFSLKDESARVQCVMFRQQAMGLDFQPTDGMRVTVRASASVFVRDGSFQLYVSSMRQAGQGDLYIRFEKLKRKLMAEGLFDPARKREIPAFPRVIGVATSQTGAALRDIIHVARRRDPNIGIVVSPCAVQGAGAAREIVRAIERLNRQGECDVMLVGRGGGSIEDLWAFNEEIVARAIAGSRIPVISCVGHETDFTIADFAADLR